MLDFKNIWPTPEEERSGAWKRMSLLAEIVFFVLTSVAIAAARVFLPGWFVMIACIAAAEFLMRAYHFWRTGVESALWIGGLLAFIFSLPSSGKPEALLVLAAAAAIAGWRVRNAFFGTVAACLVVAYLAVRHWPAMMFAFGAALLALFALTRAWRRPSTELLFQMLVIAMPIAGYVAIIRNTSETWMLFLPLAVVFAAAGIRARLRVPLIAAAICIVIAIVDAHLPLSLEAQLIAGGAIALAVAALIARVLRNRSRGFVLDVPQQSELESLLTAAVAPAILPGHAAPAGSSMSPQGGEFGGAGSSGHF